MPICISRSNSCIKKASVPVKQCKTALLKPCRYWRMSSKNSCAASRSCKNSGSCRSTAACRCCSKLSSCCCGVEKLRLKSNPVSPIATTLVCCQSCFNCCQDSGVFSLALWGWKPAVAKRSQGKVSSRLKASACWLVGKQVPVIIWR